MKNTDKLKLFKDMIELKYCMCRVDNDCKFMLKKQYLFDSGFKCYKFIDSNMVPDGFKYKNINMIDDTLNIFDFLNDITNVIRERKTLQGNYKDSLVIKDFLHIYVLKKYNYDHEFIHIEVYIHNENLYNFLNAIDEKDFLLSIENNDNKKTKRGRL